MIPPISNTLILYADDGYLSHQVRFVLHEKNLVFGENNIRENNEQFEDLADLNPYNTLPVLVYRDLILYQNMVIFEYLEDRYYQNKLLPDTPNEKAKYRQLIWRINHDWLQLADILLTHSDTLDKNRADKARKQLSEHLITLSPLFAHQPYFLSDKIGLCDCILLPMLYRLEEMDIYLPANLSRPLLQYMQRMFARPTFQQSLHF